METRLVRQEIMDKPLHDSAIHKARDYFNNLQIALPFPQHPGFGRLLAKAAFFPRPFIFGLFQPFDGPPEG
jgi:hypothetical protein